MSSAQRAVVVADGKEVINQFALLACQFRVFQFFGVIDGQVRIHHTLGKIQPFKLEMDQRRLFFLVVDRVAVLESLKVENQDLGCLIDFHLLFSQYVLLALRAIPGIVWKQGFRLSECLDAFLQSDGVLAL